MASRATWPPVGSAIVVFETDAAGAEPAAPAPKAEAPKPVAPPPVAPPAPKQNGAAPVEASEPKPRIKAQSGAVWSEETVQAAMQGAAPQAKPVPAAATPVSKAAPQAAPKASQAVARAEPREPSVREWAQAQASPAVRARAQKLGVDLGQIRGTGPDGRVTHEDLDAVLVPAVGARRASSALAEKNGVEPVKVIGLRRKIAEKMQDAKRRIPHFAYVEEADLTELEELRAHLNATKRNDQPKLTLLPFLMRALVLALPDFPQINARYDDEQGVVYRHDNVDIGIATQTDNGLIVPVVRHAEARDVWDAARKSRASPLLCARTRQARTSFRARPSP
jgi:2-oxoisovalerate dehydrogenase E2 component (dihydrolipoyl transacylase)